MKQSLLVMCMISMLALHACDRDPMPNEGAVPAERRTPTLVERTLDFAHRLAARMGAAVSEVTDMASSSLDISKKPTDRQAGKAEAMIEQVKDALADDRPDMAKTVMEHLRSMKDSLSEEVQMEMARLDAMLADQPPPASRKTSR